MWQDKLITRWLDDERVKVVRSIESPATPDELAIVFSDGSRLHLRAEADHPPEAKSECEAAAVTSKTTAVRFYSEIVRTLYDHAIETFIDTDLPPARVLIVDQAPDGTPEFKEHLNQREPF